MEIQPQERSLTQASEITTLRSINILSSWARTRTSRSQSRRPTCWQELPPPRTNCQWFGRASTWASWATRCKKKMKITIKGWKSCKKWPSKPLWRSKKRKSTSLCPWGGATCSLATKHGISTWGASSSSKPTRQRVSWWSRTICVSWTRSRALRTRSRANSRRRAWRTSSPWEQRRLILHRNHQGTWAQSLQILKLWMKSQWALASSTSLIDRVRSL